MAAPKKMPWEDDEILIPAAKAATATAEAAAPAGSTAMPWEQDEILVPAPAAAQPPPANAGNTKPEVGSWKKKAKRILLGRWAEEAPADAHRVTAGEVFFPSVQEHNRTQGGKMGVGRIGAIAEDLISMPKRLLEGEFHASAGDADKAIEAVTRTEARSIPDAIQREAPLMFVPALRALGGSGKAGRIGGAFLAGAGDAIPSTVLHQAERRAEGKEVSLPEAAGELASGGLVRGGFQTVGEAFKAMVPPLRKVVSRFTEVPKEALDEVTGPGGAKKLEEFKAAARKYGTEEGTNLTPMAEEVGARVGAENAARTAAVEGRRAAQRLRLEEDVVGLRNRITGGKAKRLPEISADAQGQAIKESLESAKKPLQERFVEGDRAAYGGLRAAPALTRKAKRIVIDNSPTLMPDGQGGLVEAPGSGASREVVEEVPVLPEKIGEVLSEFKALKPEEGVPKITPGAAKGIKWLQGLAGQAKTVDDLIDLKAQARHLQASGGFEGALFDASRDDLALAKVLQKIHEVEAASIRKAAPKRAPKVLPLVEANNKLYGETLEKLRKGDLRFRATQNSESIIAKVKQMGPEEARDLMAEMGKNEVLGPYVKELQNGFVDDLLLSSAKNGEFDPKAFSKTWSNVSADLKKAWLPEEIITRVDEAVKKGLEEIPDPKMVGERLFGKSLDVFGAERKLANIASAEQKKALAELQALDALFGTDYTQEAIAAYRSKQLQLGTKGELPKMGGIRTGKGLGGMTAAMTSMGSAGAAAGAAVGGPVGAAVGGAIGSAAGAGAGFYLQSPAGAILMFRAFNRLEGSSRGGREVVKRALPQAVRSAVYGDDDE